MRRRRGKQKEGEAREWDERRVVPEARKPRYESPCMSMFAYIWSCSQLACMLSVDCRRLLLSPSIPFMSNLPFPPKKFFPPLAQELLILPTRNTMGRYRVAKPKREWVYSPCGVFAHNSTLLVDGGARDWVFLLPYLHSNEGNEPVSERTATFSLTFFHLFLSFLLKMDDRKKSSSSISWAGWNGSSEIRNVWTLLRSGAREKESADWVSRVLICPEHFSLPRSRIIGGEESELAIRTRKLALHVNQRSFSHFEALVFFPIKYCKKEALFLANKKYARRGPCIF